MHMVSITPLIPLRLCLWLPLPLPLHTLRRPGTHHPVLHRQPLAPALLRGLNLRNHGCLQRPHERHRLQRQHIVVALHARPAPAFRGKQVVSPLLLVQGPHAGIPVVAEEAVKHAREIEARDDEAAEIGDEGYGGVGGGRRRRRRGGRLGSENTGRGGLTDVGGGDRRRRVLEREVDVHERGDGLDGPGLLGVFDKVALAGLIFRVPVEADTFRSVYAANVKWSS